MIGLNRLGLPARPVLSARIRSEPFLYATTTTPGETVTIHRITPTGGSITISWGDGEATTVADGVTAAQAHVYAAAGTFEIRVTPLILVTQLDIHDAKLSGFRSAQLAGNTMTYFLCYVIGATVASVVSSSDMVAWNPTSWQLYTMPSGVYTVNSSDMSSWSPTNFRLNSMPSGNYIINSSDMASWNLTSFYLFSMPAGTYTINTANMVAWNPTNIWVYLIPPASTSWTISASDIAGFRATTSFRADANALTQAQVNSILWGLYQAAKTPRTGIGGTINVGGNNAAPSGIYQAAAGCPVSAATPGKEVAHELVNDTCAAGFNRWTSVTFTV